MTKIIAVALGVAVLAAGGLAVVFAAHASAARRAVRAYDLETAQQHIDRCLRSWRHSPSLYLDAARTARRRGDFAVAQQRLAAAARLTPRSPAVQFEELLLQAQRGELANAERPLEGLLLKAHRDELLIQEALAAGYVTTGRFQEAADCFEAMLRKDPRCAPAFLMRAQLLTSLSRDEESVPDLRRAVEVAPASSAAHLALAQVLLRLGNEGEAASHFEVVRRKQPNHPDVLLGLALCHSNAGETDEAKRLLDALLARQPDHPAGLAERGRLALREGQPERAEELCRRALAAAPTDAVAWQVLSLAFHAQSRAEDAARALDEHCHFDGATVRLRYLAGQLQEKPNDPDLLTQIGAAYLELNLTATAEQFLTRALSVDPGHAPARQLLMQMRRRSRLAPPAAAAKP